jgi:hypothetical protein
MLSEHANGDWGAVCKDYRKPLKCYVKEDFPHFLVTDGYFFVRAHFTKEAVDDFKAKYGASVRMTSLSDKVIVIMQWTLDL